MLSRGEWKNTADSPLDKNCRINAAVTKDIRYLKQRFPEARAFQVSMSGTRDYVTEQGIVVIEGDKTLAEPDGESSASRSPRAVEREISSNSAIAEARLKSKIVHLTIVLYVHCHSQHQGPAHAAQIRP